ncbi:MAG: hypothetical protein GY943_11455, partial [Chloroflexi bacterium]|nr:hypothetical protein [Chloroflexota bacterium]
EELYIMSGWTYRPDSTSSGNVTGVHVENNGTILFDGNTVVVGGNWENYGSVNGGTSDATIKFTQTSGTAAITFGTASYGTIEFDDGGGTTTFEIQDAGDVDGAFTVTSGTVDMNGNSLQVAGDFTLASGVTFTKSTSATVLFDGDLTYTDNTSPQQDIGNVVIGTSPDTTDLATDFTASSLTVNFGDVFNSNGYDLDIGTGGITVYGLFDATDDVEGDGTTINVAGDWYVATSGTFTADTSTVTFDATTGSPTIDMAGDAFNDVIFNDAGNDITFTLENAVDINGNMAITGGTLDVKSGENNAITLAGNWTMAEGEDFEARSGTVTFDGAGTQTVTSGTASFNDFTVASAGDVDLADELYVDGTLTISSGTLDVTASNWRIEVGESWTNNGTFTHNSGTVVFNASSGTQAFTGDTTFYDLTKVDPADDSTDVTFEVDDDTTITIAAGGTITFDGIDDDDRLNLISDNPGTRFDISIPTAMTGTWLDITDSEISGSADFTANDSLDTSNTDSAESSPQWIINESFAISGTCNKQDQVTDCADGETVRVAVNASLQAQTTTTSSGTWTISDVTDPSAGDIITVYIDGVADLLEAVAITEYDGTGTIIDMTLYEEHLTIGSGDTPAVITNADLANYDNSVSSDEDVFFEVDGSNDLTVDTTGNLSDEELYIMSGWTYRPDST